MRWEMDGTWELVHFEPDYNRLQAVALMLAWNGFRSVHTETGEVMDRLTERDRNRVLRDKFRSVKVMVRRERLLEALIHCEEHLKAGHLRLSYRSVDVSRSMIRGKGLPVTSGKQQQTVIAA
ncbi:MAG TPA: hypothetical protein VNA68_02925 [Candidatus Dormibacteraeota bacterium]|nr:hypothetical protein [Candidatus Dormibacteraeota bacterium]